MQKVVPILKFKTVKEFSEGNKYENVIMKCLTTL
jgi:hypothetical protein